MFTDVPALRAAVVLPVVLALFALASRSAFAGGQDRRSTLGRRTVCIRGVCFETEIALTEQERAQGLMFRNSLGTDRAMLFVFPEEGVHQFWMKNTLIPLDIIFIGGDRRIVSIAQRTPPCRKDPCPSYGPAGNAAYVLEINGGLSAVYGFGAGDMVEFR